MPPVPHLCKSGRKHGPARRSPGPARPNWALTVLAAELQPQSQKLLWRPSVSPHGTPRAAVVPLASCRAPPRLTGRSGDRESCEPRFWVSRCRLRLECSCSPEEIFLALVLQRQKCVLALAELPISRSPCKISIVQGGPDSPQKLLRFGLEVGSPRGPSVVRGLPGESRVRP
jgi:hypothetical protein